MNLNENAMKGKWTEIKGEIQKTWGKLTDNELEETKGDVLAIKGLLQQRYGETQKVVAKKISDVFKKFEVTKDQTMETIKNNIKS